MRWQSRQPHPGTRIIHYRCCLPALAGFANYRRGRTDGTTIETLEFLRVRLPPATSQEIKWRRERDSNPRSGYKPLTHFPGVLLQPLGHLSIAGHYPRFIHEAVPFGILPHPHIAVAMFDHPDTSPAQGYCTSLRGAARIQDRARRHKRSASMKMLGLAGTT